MDFFGYDISDFIPCEISGARCVDVHHIDSRGMGSSKEKDVIENLMGITREFHHRYGDRKQYMDFLIQVHELFMQDQIPWLQRGNTLP